MHGSGLQPRQQRKVADDHEALDVVGIRMLQRLAHGVLHAAHFGLARPEPLRQRRVVAQGVALVVAGHVGPVDAAHIFAPTQYLADKALHRRQRRSARVVRGLGALHHLVRAQHFGVEREGQQGVKEPRALGAHGVFIRAKVGQRGGNEVVKPGQCLGPIQRPAQRVGLRVAKALHACGLEGGPQGAVVVRGAGVGRQCGGAGPGLAVVVVVVPLAAFGLACLIDQHAVALAHAAVEVLHEPLLAAFEHLGHFGAGGVEVFAADSLHGKGLLCTPGAQLLVQPPFVGVLVLQRLRAVVGHEGGQVVGDGLAVAGVVNRHIAHAVPGFAQVAGQVAHGGKDGEDFLRVVQHIVRFLPHFHQHVDHAFVVRGEP